MAQSEGTARLKVFAGILIAGKDDRLAPNPPFLKLRQGAGDISGEARNCLTLLESATVREGMRTDLLARARCDLSREACPEIIRIVPFVGPDILQSQDFGSLACGIFSPNNQFVFALAQKSSNGRPGGPDAAPMEEVEYGRDRLSPA